jgi:hypothetical protein
VDAAEYSARIGKDACANRSACTFILYHIIGALTEHSETVVSIWSWQIDQWKMQMKEKVQAGFQLSARFTGPNYCWYIWSHFHRWCSVSQMDEGRGSSCCSYRSSASFFGCTLLPCSTLLTFSSFLLSGLDSPESPSRCHRTDDVQQEHFEC